MMINKESFKALFTITPPGVQGKFLFGLAGILFFFCLLWSTTIYFYQKNRLQEETFRKTELVMAAVNANRSYMQDVLRPRMYELLSRDSFVIEAMSTSFATRVIMEKFKENVPNITYRRVAINAMNPHFEAEQNELEMIEYFNKNPKIDSWQGIRVVDGERYYLRFIPVHYDTSCLRCHGRPEDAPSTIRKTYGEKQGFYMKTDRINSVASVGIRVEEGLRQISQFAAFVFSTVFISFFFLYAIIAFSFNRLIVQNIRALLDIFRTNLTDQRDKNSYRQTKARDEIGELHATAALLARNLQENRLQLEDYAENLEIKVKDRTQALQRSQDQLHQQMLNQARELQTLNIIAELITHSVDLLSILPRVLHQTLEVIPAAGAGIYLFREGQKDLFLQCQENAPELAEHFSCDMIFHKILAKTETKPTVTISETTCDELNFFITDQDNKKYLNIPLCCRNRLLGIMTLTAYDCREIDPKHRELLLSIGRQVGVTMESLQNMASLLQGKDLLQSVFDAIADLVVLISSDGILRMVNKTFSCRYHFAPESIIARSTAELAHAYPVPFKLFSHIPFNKLREPASEVSQLSNGQFYETYYYPAFDEQGKLKNIVCYAKDITLQKQVEHRMQQSEKLVAIGQLAAGVAHEINNPLGIILCYTDLLKEDLAGAPDKVKDLEIIEKHAKTCQRIVHDLLGFARNQETVRTPGQINTAIEQIAAMVASQLAKLKIILSLNLDGNIPLFNMDAEKMKQVFMNLIINATQAIGEQKGVNGKITIQSRYLQNKDQVEIIVSDNGHGIAQEIQNKIFEPFFTTKDLKEGTGLGLSLSYGIVQDHGGEIQIHSLPGQGAVFTIILPLLT